VFRNGIPHPRPFLHLSFPGALTSQDIFYSCPSGKIFVQDSIFAAGDGPVLPACMERESSAGGN